MPAPTSDPRPGDGGERRRVGVECLASEVEAVFPELVERDEAGDPVVRVEGLLLPLIRAVGELDDRLGRIEKALE